jgi:hypothetical protein
MKEKKRFQPSTMRCPNCSQTWLVAGARRGETYLCKGCGTRLIFEVSEQLLSMRLRGAVAAQQQRGSSRGAVLKP